MSQRNMSQVHIHAFNCKTNVMKIIEFDLINYTY